MVATGGKRVGELLERGVTVADAGAGADGGVERRGVAVVAHPDGPLVVTAVGSGCAGEVQQREAGHAGDDQHAKCLHEKLPRVGNMDRQAPPNRLCSGSPATSNGLPWLLQG